MATILIVDDRPSNRAYLLALLGFTEHRLLEAEDGAAALQLVRAERPDLIITDILMPTMDGYEFVQRLRADRALAATRVIFYSAVYAERETVAMARSCGVQTVLSKPSDPQDIMAAVNAELGLSAAAQGAAQEAARDARSTSGGTPGSASAPAIPAAVPTPAPGDSRVGNRLAALEEMCLHLAGARRVDALVDLFLNAAQRILDADQLALCLFDNDERTVCHLDARGLDRALLHPYATGTRLPGALLQSRQTLLLAEGDPLLGTLPPGLPRCGSFLGLAVRDLRHLYGWLYFVRAPSAAPFGPEEERWASALAAHLAVAYENLNLYDVVQRHAAQLQLEATARAEADAALRESEHRLELARQVFDSTQESIMMTDACANIVAVNPAFERITGFREADVIGLNPRVLRSGRHEAPFYRAMWDSLESSGQWRGEIWNRRKNGEVYPERTSISAVRDDEGRLTAYVSVSTDMSALIAAHNQLDFLSNHDALTLLPNRSLFHDRLQQSIAAARRDGSQLALLLVNVDRLSRINDSLGHNAGDDLLREVARRAGAIAGATDTVARLSGDEFVLLTNCEDTEDIIFMAQRLIEAIAQPHAVDGHDVVVTGSIGISVFPRDGDAPGDLLKAADAALAHQKDAGRNGFRFFKGEMNDQAMRWLALETRLRRAIGQAELALHFQPQVARADGQVLGMEALLRWHSSELGRVSPADFIPLAEDTGLILPIGDWVIRQACLQNKAWQDAGLPRVPVAVNVSAHQFKAGTVPAVVRAALVESGLEARYLEIELTESVMLGDTSAAEAQLAELRAMGVSLSLDDFGTGYSSLGYLSRFSLDKLKIDQAFVRNITTDPRSAAIAQATIALAEGLSLRVVAEGVETLDQRDFLGRIGCEVLQGYLYSQPLPAREMEALLLAGRVTV
ncbi:EAL domain-containing protein [Massilia sp. Leaf139]|uniref:two-component system response regulator n=1 Tax=Massilia sp. Leaf139 TaxID=1736272 RepID=UPI0006FB10F1|nr:EAL domain-containing protein [Massilia sp. Leaf139]KQQ88982.1 diguanylate cyclase [Massilia sp. Leaf139]